MAFDLFLERGFEETTVEQICAVAEISRSTFFRYFASKEDALLGDLPDANAHLLDALQRRPHDEPAWTALRRALDPLVERYDTAPDQGRRLARLITGTPALAAAHHAKNAAWHTLLRPEVARRLGADPDDATDPRPSALIAAALGCVDATISAWATDDSEQPLARILDRAMGAIAA